MGLFSILASTTGSKQPSKASSSSSSSSSALSIPTVVQLYAGDRPILLDDTSNVSGFTPLTYQAVQVGAADYSPEAVNNNNKPAVSRHYNPDLGVWNCRVHSKVNETIPLTGPEDTNVTETFPPLVDSLLAKVASKATTYAWTVPLADETSVEPTISLLKAALVRHLMDHPPPPVSSTSDGSDVTPIDADEDVTMKTTSGSKIGSATRTTSLYDLQATAFGLAPEDKGTENTIDKATRDCRISLMICAVVPNGSSSTGAGGDKSTSGVMDADTSYKQKQARALIVYHLRRFAYAVHASLCFVEEPLADRTSDIVPSLSAFSSNKEVHLPSTGTAASVVEISASGSNMADDSQPSIPYDKLSQLWRDLAMGIPIWQLDTSSPAITFAAGVVESGAVFVEDDDTATALYGPGRHQEDLIESVLLRNANYPGHWEASKDSLWVALPTPPAPLPPQASAAIGDHGWLNQLRDSIASAMPTAPSSGAGAGAADGTGGEGANQGNKTPKEKDAAVSSFFESLLKNP